MSDAIHTAENDAARDLVGTLYAALDEHHLAVGLEANECACGWVVMRRPPASELYRHHLVDALLASPDIKISRVIPPGQTGGAA